MHISQQNRKTGLLEPRSMSYFWESVQRVNILAVSSAFPYSHIREEAASFSGQKTFPEILTLFLEHSILWEQRPPENKWKNRKPPAFSRENKAYSVSIGSFLIPIFATGPRDEY